MMARLKALYWRARERFRRIMSGDPQTCPRRVREVGPWRRDEYLDYWRRDRWNRKDNKWPSEFPKPRTCSFCGGIHPEDALSLLQQGWEVGRTDKFYKRYLNPPGSAAYQQAIIQGLRERRLRTEVETTSPPDHPRSSPMVKLYTMHFSEEQADRFNELLADQAGP